MESGGHQVDNSFLLFPRTHNSIENKKSQRQRHRPWYLHNILVQTLTESPRRVRQGVEALLRLQPAR